METGTITITNALFGYLDNNVTKEDAARNITNAAFDLDSDFEVAFKTTANHPFNTLTLDYTVTLPEGYSLNGNPVLTGEFVDSFQLDYNYKDSEKRHRILLTDKDINTFETMGQHTMTKFLVKRNDVEKYFDIEVVVTRKN